MQSSMAKVENLAMSKRDRRIVFSAKERRCINCIWYEQYYRANRGNVALWVPVCAGNCLLQDKAYSPFKAACKCFELKE